MGQEGLAGLVALLALASRRPCCVPQRLYPPTPPSHAQAFRERKEALQAAKMKIFVRRGGPNYQAGLDMMRKLGDDIGVPVSVRFAQAGRGWGPATFRGIMLLTRAGRLSSPSTLPRLTEGKPAAWGPISQIEVYGPEASMTGICQKAIDYIKQWDADGQ